MAPTSTATTPTATTPGTEPLLVDRLDFVLPDFTRISWVGDHARNTWGPRFEAISKAWSEIEWQSVVRGVRRCALTVVSPDRFVERGGTWASNGLCAMPIELQGLNNYSYSSTPVGTELGRPFAFRLVMGSPADVAHFKRAWDDSDDAEIGRMLGFPECCIEFFRCVWVEENMVDTTWPMAVRTAAGDGRPDAASTRSIEVGGPIEANILWRWAGLRCVPHLPCSASCEASADYGRKLLQVGDDLGYGEEMAWLREILAWPVEWSALHGVAEVKTPLLKISTRTDATASKLVVRRPGDSYPAEGSRGLSFPYRVQPVSSFEQMRFQRGLDNPIADTDEPPAWYASDNGFASATAMDAAHSIVVELALRTLARGGGTVIDLGCGNGALLRKLHAANPRVRVAGVEHDPERAEHARQLLGAEDDALFVGDMFEIDWAARDGETYALAILMPGRLVESGPERAQRFRQLLRERCDRILVYAYGDWLKRFGNLAGLARQVGLRLVGAHGTASASLAEVAE